MEAIRRKVVELAGKNANPSFLSDVQSKAEELFAEFKECASRYSEELKKLKQINLLNEKVRFFVELIIFVAFMCALCISTRHHLQTSAEMGAIEPWIQELEVAQNLPEVATPGALFQTKAKYKKLKEQTDRRVKTAEEIMRDSKQFLVFCMDFVT